MKEVETSDLFCLREDAWVDDPSPPVFGRMERKVCLRAGQIVRISDSGVLLGLTGFIWVRLPSKLYLFTLYHDQVRKLRPLEALAAQAIEWVEWRE